MMVPYEQKIIDLNNIRMDARRYPEMIEMVRAFSGYNDGCILHPHWQKFSARDMGIFTASDRFKSLSWMGDGFPQTTSYRQPLEDSYFLRNVFANWDCIDVQSGVYQFYRIANWFEENDIHFTDPNQKLNVIEVGGGYGRLAMIFLAYFGADIHWVNVDFAPSSLLFSGQVMRQLFPHLNIADTFSLQEGEPLDGYNFVSLPAWRISEVGSKTYDLGVNVHSFQEMTRKSVAFYKGEVWRCLHHQGYFYLINNPPENGQGGYTSHDYYNIHNLFNLEHENKYPIGADWEQICGVPTLERIFSKGDPNVIDTICDQCGNLFAVLQGDPYACPQCGAKYA